MKTSEILDIINRFLSADKAKQFKQSDDLMAVLKKLKKKELSLKKKLEMKKIEYEKNAKNLKLLKKRLTIISAQRQKGINAVIKLKQQ